MSLIGKISQAKSALSDRLQNKIVIFLILASAQIIDSVNVTGFITAVKQIQQHYNVEYSIASWALSAYAVTFSSFIMLFGRISDVIGHHIVFSGGLFFLGIFSIVAAAVNNIYVLIVFRALQGVAAAATVPPSFAIVAHTFTGKALSIAIGCMAGVMVTAVGVGLLAGGAFSESGIGYKGLLWLSAGYTLINGLLAVIAIKPKETKTNFKSLKRLDYFGIFLFISGAILLVTGFTEAGESWKRPRAYAPIIVGVVLIISFLLWEILFFNGSRGKSIELMIPREMWSVTNFKSIPLITFFLNGGVFGMFLIASNYFVDVVGDSPIISAVKVAIPSCVTMIMVVICMSLNYGKVSPKTLCVAGLLVGLIGNILLTRLTATIKDYWRFAVPGLILFAGGTNLYFINYLNLIMMATPLEMQGLVSGICLTLGQFGTAVVFSGITSIVGNSDETVESKKQLSKIHINSMYLTLAVTATGIILASFFVKNLTEEDQAEVSEEEPNDEEQELAVNPVKVEEVMQNCTNASSETTIC